MDHSRETICMKDNRRPGKSTRLVFCGPAVDPDVVTELLELQPTHAQRPGEMATYSWSKQEYMSSVGTWELKFPSTSHDVETEQEVEEWLLMLRPKVEA